MELNSFYRKRQASFDLSDSDGYALARIVIEHKDRYTIQTNDAECLAEVTGHFRYSVDTREDFPVVGDWVKVSILDEGFALIHEVLPRKNMLKRQAVGKFGETQGIAANIDCAFLVQAVDRDFNLKRLDRYISICHASRIDSLVLLTKSDLIDKEELNKLVLAIRANNPDLDVISLSNISMEGFGALKKMMQPFLTYCFLGSSGIGKSSIINNLLGSEVLRTSSISTANQKGRHTTSHRELLTLPNYCFVIDTPGMREVGITDESVAVDRTFEWITSLADQCRFKDCSHSHEDGCAILKAVALGEISEEVYDSYQKLKREQTRFSESVHEKRRKSKQQGKLYKSIQEEKRKRKY